MQSALSIPLVLTVLTVVGAQFVITVPSNDVPADNEPVPSVDNRFSTASVPQTILNPSESSSYDSDFWIRYLLALRYSQLANRWNNYYGFNNVQPNPVYNPVITIGNPSPPVKENCREIGQPCTYHEDCCSFACLTYLARCVSG